MAFGHDKNACGAAGPIGQDDTAARGSNVPGFHLAVGSGAGLAMLPAVHAGADSERVRAIGLIPELDYPAILPAHKNVGKLPRAIAVFE